MSEARWYAEGLRFGCTRCGHCCVGAGSVRVTDDEIADLARSRGLAEAEFRAMYTRTLRGGEVSLRDKRNKDCVFYERRRGCTVYAHRPRQCRTWPFWRAVVHSRERWEEESQACPGMDRGRLRSAGAIDRSVASDGTSGSLASS
jgi:Fe-S-cluster containining protein